MPRARGAGQEVVFTESEEDPHHPPDQVFYCHYQKPLEDLEKTLNNVTSSL